MKVVCKIKDGEKVIKEATTMVEVGEASLQAAIALVGEKVVHTLYLQKAKLQALAKMRTAMSPTKDGDGNVTGPGKSSEEVVALMRGFKPALGAEKVSAVEKVRKQLTAGQLSKDDIKALLADLKAQLQG